MPARHANLLSGSADLDPARSTRRAERHGLFRSLERIYADLPDTVCENCARCCFESPGIFYVEYLHALDLIGRYAERRREDTARRAFGELLFSWVEPERTCIFLQSQRCTIYDRRPLACRLFGLVPAPERERAEAEARLAARQEARRLQQFGIDVPEAVVRRSLTSCDKVTDAAGRAVTVDGEGYAARVARLDAVLLPKQTVIEEFCFRSLPERLAAAAFGAEAVDGMRTQLLRRAQAGASAEELVRLVLRQTRLPRPFLAQRRRAHDG